MNRGFIHIAVACAVGFLGLQLEAQGTGTPLPFSDSFDTYGMGATPGSPWTTNGTGTAKVTNAPTPASGAQLCDVSDLDLVLDVDETSGNYTNVYWLFYTQPIRYDDEEGASPPTNFTGAAAAFYVTTNGGVKAYRNNTTNEWYLLAGADTVPSNTWVGFRVQVRYGGGGTYDVFMTTNGYGTAMTQVGSSLNLPSTAPAEMGDVAVYNTFKIDAVSLYLPAAPGGGIGLPFFDGFEAYALGPLTNSAVAMQYWSLTGDGALALVTNGAGLYYERAQGLHMTNANLTLNIDENQGIYSNVWCQMYIKPTGYEDDGGDSAPSVAANAAAALYVSTTGVLRAYTYNGASNTWTNLLMNVSTSQWIGISMHMDYSGRKWDVYYTTNGYGTAMTRANTFAMGIQTNASAVTEIGEVVVQHNVELDAVSVSKAGTSVTNAATGAGSNLVSLVLAGGTTNLMGVLVHHYGSGGDTLAGAFGADLMSGFAQGDKVAFYYTNGWNQYVLSGDTWIKARFADMAPSNVHITPGMGMRVIRLNPTNTVVFYPYDQASNISVAVYGTNNTAMGGWNLLAWPKLTNSSAASGWGFVGVATNGDRIYIDGAGYNQGQLWWDMWGGGAGGVPGPANKWAEGPAASTYILTPGKAFWYFRRTGTNTWSLP